MTVVCQLGLSCSWEQFHHSICPTSPPPPPQDKGPLCSALQETMWLPSLWTSSWLQWSQNKSVLRAEYFLSVLSLGLQELVGFWVSCWCHSAALLKSRLHLKGAPVKCGWDCWQAISTLQLVLRLLFVFLSLCRLGMCPAELERHSSTFYSSLCIAILLGHCPMPGDRTGNV